MLHTHDPKVADAEEFVRDLRHADAVWFEGGRQWNLVDSYAGTLTLKEIRKVLERGGVVGGTSEGATIQDGYLVRGRGGADHDGAGEEAPARLRVPPPIGHRPAHQHPDAPGRPHRGRPEDAEPARNRLSAASTSGQIRGAASAGGAAPVGGGAVDVVATRVGRSGREGPRTDLSADVPPEGGARCADGSAPRAQALFRTIPVPPRPHGPGRSRPRAARSSPGHDVQNRTPTPAPTRFTLMPSVVKMRPYR